MSIHKAKIRPQDAEVVVSLIHGDMDPEEFHACVSNPIRALIDQCTELDINDMETIKRGFSVPAPALGTLLAASFHDQCENLQDFMSKSEPLIKPIGSIQQLVMELLVPVVIEDYRMAVSGLVDRAMKENNPLTSQDPVKAIKETIEDIGPNVHERAMELILTGTPTIFAAFFKLYMEYSKKGHTKIGLYAFRNEAQLTELIKKKEEDGTINEGLPASEAAYDEALKAMMEANNITSSKKK